MKRRRPSLALCAAGFVARQSQCWALLDFLAPRRRRRWRRDGSAALHRTGPRARLRRPLPLLCLLAALAGCTSAPLDDQDEAALVLEAAPARSDEPAEAAAARAAMEAGRYDDARVLFERLVPRTTDPPQRAEYLFYAAEAGMGERNYFHAYRLYQRLLSRYPATPHFATAVERVFLIGRLFCEGKATKPSWLLGISLEDREWGVTVLEAFIEGRERHPFADDALHAIAGAQLELHEYELAIASWQRLRGEYPESEWADTAEYRAAVTMFTLSDGPRYDKRPMYIGLDRLRRYVRERPTGDHVSEAQQVLAEKEEDLAAHKLGIARFYLRRDRTYAADLYLAAVQSEFPATESAKEAKTLQARLPKTSPPPPPPDPEELQGPDDRRDDRLRLAPAPIDDSW